jgi:WD40 repeat protein
MFLKIVRVFLLLVALFCWGIAFKILWFKSSYLPKHTYDEITYIRGTYQGFSQIPHAFSPDGKILAIGRADGTVSLPSLESHQEVMSLAGNKEAIVQTWFSPNGKTLAASDQYGGLFVWDLETRKKTPFAITLQWLAFTPDSKDLLYQDSDRKTHVWDLAERTERAVLETQFNTYSLALFPNGRTLAGVIVKVKDDNKSTVRKVVLWKLATGEKQGPFSFDSQKIYSIAAIAPDNNNVLLHSLEGNRLFIWNVKNGKVIPGPSAEHVELVRFSADGKTLTTLGSELKTWDAKTWQEITSVPIERGWSQSLAEDWHALAVAKTVPQSEGFVRWFLSLFGAGQHSHQMVQLWEVKSGSIIANFPDASLPVFSPDGKTLATINQEGLVQLWDIPPRKNYLRTIGLWTLVILPLVTAFCLLSKRIRKRSQAVASGTS